MTTATDQDPLAPGLSCLPANPIYFREALEAALPVLQAQMDLEAEGQVDWQAAQREVLSTFMGAYDPEASEEERYSALWRVMKLFELLQEAVANPKLAGSNLAVDAEAGCFRINPALLAHAVMQPMVIGEKFEWESVV